MNFPVPIATAALLLSCGCALRPPPPTDAPLRMQAPLAITGPAATDSAAGAWPHQAWWRDYQDPALDSLLERALAADASPTLATAAARLEAARQAVRVTGAALGVQVAANASVTRQRLSDNALLPTEVIGFNWTTQADLGVAAEWRLDWWGRQRALLAAAVDEARAAQAEQAAARLALAGAIVQAWAGWQLDAARLALAAERTALVERASRIAGQRAAAGLDSGETPQRAAQSVAAAREHQALLEASQRLRVVTLAALLGVDAQGLPPLVARELPRPDPSLPARLSIDLLARRPDIAAARWRVEAARETRSAARAEYYPDVSLRALAGLSSIRIGELLHPGSSVPALGAAIHLPLFDGGLRDARLGARQAELARAIADYDATVVDAAREVGAITLRLAQTAEQRAQRDAARAAAAGLHRAALARVAAGTADLRPGLAAGLALLAERDALLQVEHELLHADIALQVALGGGHDSSPQVPR